jgi:hypothetical protein
MTSSAIQIWTAWTQVSEWSVRRHLMMGNLQEIPRLGGIYPMVSYRCVPSKTKQSIEHPPVVPVACASTIQLQKQLKIPMEFRSSRTIPARTPVTRRKGWATPTIKLPRMIVPKWYPGSQSEVGISTNLSILNHGYLLIYTINQPVYLVICLASILIYIYTLDSYVAYIRSFASLSLSPSLSICI